jgi:hypothetical protein
MCKRYHSLLFFGNFFHIIKDDEKRMENLHPMNLRQRFGCQDKEMRGNPGKRGKMKKYEELEFTDDFIEMVRKTVANICCPPDISTGFRGGSTPLFVLPGLLIFALVRIRTL